MYEPFITELLKELSYRQIQEEKENEERKKRRLERLENSSTSRREPRKLVPLKEDGLNTEN